MNSLTFVSSELYGRSYGGGVMTYEPSEVEEFKIPKLIKYNLDHKFIDNNSRIGNIDKIVDYVDDITLRQYIGLNKKEILIIKNAWLKLSNKRILRNK